MSNDATHVGYRDLTAALSAAAPGATLTIKGTCVASNVTGGNADFVIWHDVTLKGVANKVFGTPTLMGTGERTVVEVVGSTVTLIGLTIAGAGGNYSSGGLFNDHGVVTIVNSTVTGNSAWTAAGIGNNGTMVLSHSTISDNTAVYGGGGIYNAGTLTMTDSEVSGNTSTLGAAGGIFNFNNCVDEGSGILTVANSTFSGNTAAQWGGAIFNQGYWNTYVERSCLGAVTLTDSTISDNTAGWNGGGINNVGIAAIDGSIVSGNKATNGAGIANMANPNADPATLAITDSTVGDNTTTGVGGGILNGLGPSTSILTVTGSTVSGNAAVHGAGILNWGSATISGSTISANTAAYVGGIVNAGALTFVAPTTTVGGNVGAATGGVQNGPGTVTGGCPTILGGQVLYDPANTPPDFSGFTCP